ncbi:MAG TPA: response regulator [Bacteroidota bacterium]|nr:response regulator [Bacteroidota bacterium]
MGTEAKARILVVDDEDDLRMLLEHVVTSAGYAVTTAEDGQDAIAKIQNNTFDLALLDIQMPNASGIEVLKFIRTNAPATKAIMLTGYADLNYAMEARQFGAKDFISKPYKLEDIIRTIENVLAG